MLVKRQEKAGRPFVDDSLRRWLAKIHPIQVRLIFHARPASSFVHRTHTHPLSRTVQRRRLPRTPLIQPPQTPSTLLNPTPATMLWTIILWLEGRACSLEERPFTETLFPAISAYSLRLTPLRPPAPIHYLRVNQVSTRFSLDLPSRFGPFCPSCFLPSGWLASSRLAGLSCLLSLCAVPCLRLCLCMFSVERMAKWSHTEAGKHRLR